MKTLALALCGCLGLLVPAWAQPVTQVTVAVRDTRGGTSEPLRQKMEASMRAVSQQLFLEKDTEKIAADTSGYEKLLGEISDRVLTGYQTEQVVVLPGAETKIIFKVAPWNSVIRRPKIDLEFSGVSPSMATYLQGKMPELKKRLAALLEGASVDAVGWAGSVLRGQVLAEVQQELPDFKAAVDLTEQQDQVVLQIVIYPVGEVVRQVQYQMFSQSIPNVLLINIKEIYAEKVNNLRGLPVAFVKDNRAELEQMLLEQLRAEQMVQDYHLQPQVSLLPGVDLKANLAVESTGYKIWFEGYGDIGRNDHNLSGRAHLGHYFTPKDEIFAEAGVQLDEVHWDYGLGYARHQGKTTLSYLRRAPYADNDYRIEYDFTPKWRLRYEYFSGDNVKEWAIRYRIHEFLSGEYVFSSDKSYFRIVGNL